jgi:Spy/CpxP family protein refolding chaperone
MKAIFKIVFALLMLMSVGKLQAQECRGGHGHHGGMMKETLGLTDAQAKQFDAIHEKYRPQIQAVWATESTDHEAQIAKVKAIREAMRAEVHAILTPEQQAKADALHAEGAPHGRHPGGMGSGNGHHHGKHGGQGGHHAQKEFHDRLEPILLAQRAKLEPQISADDKAQIATLRTQMDALHTQMKAAHADMRKAHEAGQQPTEAQRAEMEKLHTQKRAIMDQAVTIGERYKTQVQALHDEAMPQIEPIMKEMEAQQMKHMHHQGSGSAAKSHGECHGKGKGQFHHGPMGHGGEFDHSRMIGRFILMDPNAPAATKTTKAAAKAATHGSIEAEAQGLDVFPNPSANANAIRYDVKLRGQVRIELMSIEGKVIRVILDGEREAGSHSMDVNTTDLPAGSYFYRVIDASGSRVKRFAIAK